jgi:iron-sulfur cluster assembly protein
MITITESAKEQVKLLIKQEGYTQDYFLRVGVKGGGCAGFSYILEFDNKIVDGDEKIELEDINIVTDRKSLLYIFGTELDWSGGLNGKGFEWKNPNATRTCSCGTSFGA